MSRPTSQVAGRVETTLYWAFSGALMGLGVAGAFSVGIPILIAGIFFTSFGLARLEHRGLWAALVGAGAVPTCLFLYNYLNTDSSHTYLLTNNIVISLFVPFGAITLAGLAWGLVEALHGRPRANRIH